MIILVPLVAPPAPLDCYMMPLNVPIISIADMIQNFSDRTTTTRLTSQRPDCSAAGKNYLTVQILRITSM